MSELAILIPFSSTEKYRLMNLEFIQKWYAERFPGVPQIVADDGSCRAGWTKAYAIQNCIDQTDADVFIVADSDCICEAVTGAARAVLSGDYEWAVPHSQIRRLDEASSEVVRNGNVPTKEMALEHKPYAGVSGGGIVVLTREAWSRAPMDPRFKVTHGEDVAWARGLKFLCGKPWKGLEPLYHLFHPPIHAVGMRFRANQKLAAIYRNTTSKTIESVINEGREFREPGPVTPRAAQGTVAILVPVMARPGAARPLMASLGASQPWSGAVYAIADPVDLATQEAWQEAGATVLVSDRGSSFAQKVNYGYEATSEEWMLLIGDDVRFHPGWMQALLEAAGDKYDLVATNDMCRSDQDKLAVHPFIRRSYVRDLGASFDGPGLVAHEGYHHWYVDREWSFLAIERGVYTSASDAKVEHLHPIFGKGETDQVYLLGQSKAQADARTFRGRTVFYEKRVRRSSSA